MLRLRPLTTSALLFALLGILPASASEAGTEPSDAEPSGVELSVQAGDQLLSRVSSLPIFKVYNADGKQILDLKGLGSDFRGQLEGLIQQPSKPAVDAPTLTAELALMLTEEGTAVDPASLPQADLTFVKYWADWCIPCRTQSQIVKDLKADHPSARINVVHVEADPAKK